jgi:hypothetical protein
MYVPVYFFRVSPSNGLSFQYTIAALLQVRIFLPEIFIVPRQLLMVV